VVGYILQYELNFNIIYVLEYDIRVKYTIGFPFDYDN
jgi:hypothetical protein